MNYIVNVIKDQKTIRKLSFKEDKTFLDIRKEVEVENYYMVVTSPCIFWEKQANYSHFDFIYRKNDIIWNPKIDDTLIKDYVNTYNINKIDVYLIPTEIGDTSGGLNLEQTIEIIKSIVSILWDNRDVIEFIASMVGITDVFVKISNFLTNKIKKINSNESHVKAETYIYSIICRDNWNLDDFKKMHIIKTEKEAEIILLLLGYRYDKKNNRYHITKKSRTFISENIKTIVIELENKFSKN